MIRILRLIEYVYDTPLTAEKDMAGWHAPPIGAVEAGPHKSIRSTILTNLDHQEHAPTESYRIKLERINDHEAP